MARARLRKLTILFTSSLMFLASAVAPGLPALYDDYAHLANAEMLSRMVLTMPMLFAAIAGPFAGFVVDQYGRRNTLLVSTIGFGLAGLSGLFLESLIAIIAGRAILGIFLATMLTSVTALIGDYYTGDQRTKVLGIQGAFITFGTFVFVILAGFLSEIHWSASFFLFATAFVLIIPMVLSLYESSLTQPARHDQLAEPAIGWRKWGVIGWVCILAFVSMIALFMVPSQTQFFLIDIGIGDPTRAGIAIGVFNFSSGIAALAYPFLRRRFSVASIFALIFFDLGFGFALVGTADGFFDVMVGLAIGGISVGVFLPNANLAIISRTTIAVRGRALGAMTTMLFLGQFASPFYSLPLGEQATLGGAFTVTSYWVFGLGAFFVVLAVIGRRKAKMGSGAAGGTR